MTRSKQTLKSINLIVYGASMALEFLWYIPNFLQTGHRGDNGAVAFGLDFSTELALECERHHWSGALLGTGWGRPDTFTVGTSIAARTTSFKPLVAVRPGYWSPAQFATSAATLDQLSGGRLLINIVSGQDNPAAYGDTEVDQPTRYARTREFMQLTRRLWTEENVTFRGEHYQVTDASIAPRPYADGDRRHPTLYFGGASAAAEETAAAEADVQLFWGEPLAGVAERIERLKGLQQKYDRAKPLEFGLRITTLVRDTTEEAWRDAEAKVAAMAEKAGQRKRTFQAVGQQRLLDLQQQGDVLDANLYTAPGRFGGGGAGTTWLVGSPADVIASLRAYQDLGITHFILSDTPYKQEVARVGDSIAAAMRAPVPA